MALLKRRLNQLGEGHIQVAPALGMLVEAHLERGDVAAAAEAAARLERVADVHGQAHARALAKLASARVAEVRGRPDDAVTGFEDTLEEFSRLELPFETAQVRFELARATADRDQELAVAEAQRALRAFEELGARTCADEAASLLRSLGVAPRTGPKHVGLLTRREQEVLRLVGLGLSNPEIAQRLFITRKTAAHHVSNLLAKLGLRNRAEAVAYAATWGQGPSAAGDVGAASTR